MTAKYGVLGMPLGHSYSERIHQLLGNDDYKKLELSEEELERFLKKREFSGYNVTIPYKKTVMPYCDNLGEGAAKIGSVNTLICRDGKLTGENTDFYGLAYAADRADIKFEGKKILILGAGGTSLAARATAQSRNAAAITVMGHAEIAKGDFSAVFDSEIVINTTPVGMWPNSGSSPVDLSVFKNCKGVIDAVYNPLYTRFLIQARELGIPHTGGLPMLVAQAAMADCLFFDKSEPNKDQIEKIIKKLSLGVSNIVLIGMAGSGKTTVGEAVAKMTGRSFADTDKIVTELAEMSIPQIFAEQGEDAFRKLEADVVKEISRTKGAVIATGGGVVKNIENCRELRQNGIIVWLDRPPEALELSGRPLMQNRAVAEKLYNERKPLYKSFADYRIDCGGKGLSEVISKLLLIIDDER